MNNVNLDIMQIQIYWDWCFMFPFSLPPLPFHIGVAKVLIFLEGRGGDGDVKRR
jgi:hypothetical protein